MRTGLLTPLLIALFGCNGRGPIEPPPDANGPVESGPVVEPGSEPQELGEAEAKSQAGTPIVLVTDRLALRALEAEGLSAGALAFAQGGAGVATFNDSPGFTRIHQSLKSDVAAEEKADPKAGVGMKHGHRLFDLAWFDADADKTRFELIGVVNRTDRRPFARERCGETRLIYRLAYTSQVEGEAVNSRLPMTLNVVFWQDAEACEAAAKRWLAADPDLAGEALKDWLRRADGPLAPERLVREQLKSVEVNLQVMRWPGVMHPSLGGHASYVLRVFHRDGDSLSIAPLENTPDVAGLRRDAPERAALLAWLREPETLAALDDGTAVMPDRFAATRSISVTPRGLGRIANRPFSQLFDADDFDGLDLSGRETISTAGGLLRRLDGLTCAGCHETRSVAGFHLLGEPDDPGQILDAMFVPTSPHLDGELDRRAAYVAALADGRPGDEARPHSDFERHRGAYGSHCGLGDPAFASWTCVDELTCVALDDPDMGVCLTKERTAGDPCELGDLKTREDATRDRLKNMRVTACDGGAICNATKVGFPGGMCTKTCDGLGEGEACGAIVNLTSFNACVGAKRPFPKCIEKAAFEAGMRRCDADSRCRDDYICARSPMDPDTGVCLPPYFLFQMRVDGHVL